LKIIHIIASYKPAYIYGGPIQSVAKLCEVLEELSDQRLAVGDDAFKVQVFTTTANGTKELDVKTGIPVLIEGVPVTYFKRWTKDHSHFSPGLLWELRKMLRQVRRDRQNKPPRLAAPPSKEGNIIHIHAWWNLVSVLSCFIAKWYRIPVILSPRGMLTSYTLGNRNSLSKTLIHKLLGKKLLKYCHIHATSEQERADILGIVRPKSIRVIPNLVSSSLEDQDSECVAGSENKIAIREDKVEPYQDRVATRQDKVTTSQDKLATRQDKVATRQDKVTPRQDKVTTSQDKVTTSQDNVTTSQDKVTTRQDKVVSSGYQIASIENRTADSFKLIFLSRIEEKKGLELLFKALAAIEIPWSLTIAGSGEKQYLQSLKQMARELKLSDKIYWLGQVNNQDKYTLMAAHDLLVLTSYNENFANVVVESLSVGTAVLVSEQVGLSDYVKDNELGWVTGLEIEEIQKTIITAYQSPEKRQNIRSTASLAIRKDFNDNTLAKQYLDFYEIL